jgi:putative ABC transport system permease protein
VSNLTYSLRSLGRAPLIAVASMLTVALAITGTTSVFALLDAAVLRSLPYADADRLVAVWTDITEIAGEVGIQDPLREYTNLDTHRDLRAAATTLGDLAVFSGWAPSFRGQDGAERIPGVAVTWNGLGLLGVRPVAGRLFTETEGWVGAGCTVAISEGFWNRHFQADPAIVGSELALTGEVCTVVAVLPSSFRFPFAPTAEIFTALRSAGNDRGAAYLRQFGRLAGGSTLEQAQAELGTLAASLRAQYPAAHRGDNFFVEPLQEALNRGVRAQLTVLQAAAVFVLVIAIANLASLMVARVLARAREFEVRASLGASRWRQFGLLWTENTLIAAVGAVAGILLTLGSIDVVTRALPAGFNDTWDVRVGAKAFTVAAGAALIAASVMAGVAYVALTRSVGHRTGTTAGERLVGDRVSRRVTAGLVASNFAVALAVAVTGVLLVQSYQRLSAVDVGFGTDGVIAGTVGLPPAQYPDNAALVAAYDRLAMQIEQMPGVQQAGLASTVPLGTSNNDTFVLIDGRPTAREDGRAHTWLTRANEGYFDAMGVRIVEGRAFESADRAGGRAVAVVNAAFVRDYFADGRAIGTRVALGPEDNRRWFEIVGVANDVRYFDLAVPESPALYLPAWLEPSRGMYIVVRSERGAAAVIPDLRRAVTAFDPTLALVDARSNQERVTDRLMIPRTISALTLAFALTALLLAAVGVYGTLAQSVVRRAREFGVRRALGARDGDVTRQVLRQGLTPVAVGLAAGVPLALFLGRRLSRVLYEVSPAQPTAWIIALVILLFVAAVAALLPSRNAVRVPPMQALRGE